MHPDTFNYLMPTPEQLQKMDRLREAARIYCTILESEVPDGPDKTFIIRSHRTNAMWANIAVTRTQDGTPRL